MPGSPLRKIHLDFHTHPSVHVGADFEPGRFADDIASTGADGVVLFAKDHYGHAFYRNSAFAVHPRLETDFLPLAAKACRDRGLYVEAYISVGLDNLAWLAHPDWACRNIHGHDYRWGEPNVLLDLASPLLERVALPFTREVARRIEADGVWFDIVLYPDDCFYSEHLTRELQSRGLPDEAAQRGLLARTIVIEAQQQLREAALAENPNLGIVFNNQALPGDTRAWAYNDTIDIESDPAVWPLFDMPLRTRHAVSAGRTHGSPPHCALTTRFHRCWGDFGGLRSAGRLEWELGRIFASGTKRVALGDHLHPCGEFDAPVLRAIARAFDRCRQVAPLLDGAWPVSEVAILVEPNPNPYSTSRNAAAEAALGAARFLTAAHRQYAVRDTDAPPAPGEVLLLPGGAPLGAADIGQVKRLVAAGHPLLACGAQVIGFEDLAGAGPAEKTALKGQYLQYENELWHDDLGDMPMALYDAVWTLNGTANENVIAHCRPPLFDETLANNYHAYGPVDRAAAPLPAIVSWGNVVLCGVPLPALVHRENAWYFQYALDRLLAKLSPGPIVEATPAGIAEIALHRRGNTVVVHIVSGPEMPSGITLKLRVRPSKIIVLDGDDPLSEPRSVPKFSNKMRRLNSPPLEGGVGGGEIYDANSSAPALTPALRATARSHLRCAHPKLGEGPRDTIKTFAGAAALGDDEGTLLDFTWNGDTLSLTVQLDRPHEIVVVEFAGPRTS